LLPAVAVSVTAVPELNDAEQVPPPDAQLRIPAGELDTVPRPVTVWVKVYPIEYTAEPTEESE
jgi:hypothetical protein